MNKIFRLAIGALFALLPASIALAQQDYIGRYDVYTGYMYLNSPLISLGESGFHTQIGTNPTKWYSMGLDFSSGYGSTTLVPSMLKTSVQQAIATQLGAYGISPNVIDCYPRPQRGAFHPAALRPADGGAGIGAQALRNSVRRRRLHRPQLRSAGQPGGDRRRVSK
jgi:hypothetical protein